MYCERPFTNQSRGTHLVIHNTGRGLIWRPCEPPWGPLGGTLLLHKVCHVVLLRPTRVQYCIGFNALHYFTVGTHYGGRREGGREGGWEGEMGEEGRGEREGGWEGERKGVIDSLLLNLNIMTTHSLSQSFTLPNTLIQHMQLIMSGLKVVVLRS